MKSTQPITARQIADVIFQEPDRFTKDVLSHYYAPENRSLGRAMDELVECERISKMQFDQIMHGLDVVLQPTLLQYAIEEGMKVTPDFDPFYDLPWMNLEDDVNAFLGLRVAFDDATKPCEIAKGNNAAAMIKHNLISYLDFFFPELDPISPDIG